MRASHDVRSIRSRREAGVALILVMLSMLVLSVLAATIVFTARSETLASYNFKLDTQADYLAKAGIQRALNWFRSNHYLAVSQAQANTYYYVNSTGVPFNLWISGDITQTPHVAGSPVECKPVGSGGCATSNSPVQLMGYGSGLYANSSSNYPTGITNVNGDTMPKAFANDLNDSSSVNNRVSGDPNNSGYFQVNAYLLNYQTVNVSPAPSPVPAACVVTTVVTCPVETWLITSKATWTGPSSSTSTVATAEELAIVQPIYWPTWGNALYGFCSVSMIGTAGTCTDAFNSALGPYALGTPGVASGVCDSTTANNVISTGAGVGANGGVTLGSNVTVGGNVTIGSNPTSGCTASGYTGSTSSVLGEVINGPYVPPPPVPTFPAGFPSGAPNVSLSGAGATQTLPPEFLWSTLCSSSTCAWPFTRIAPAGTPPTIPPSLTDCMAGLTCNGTQPNPYLIGSISESSTSAKLNLLGGQSPLTPVYYDIACLSQTGGGISVSGYVVLNVMGGASCGGTELKIAGNGVSNGIPCTAPCTNIPPEAVTINFAGSNAAIGGNGAVSAVINAPLATVTLGGGGASGYMVGAIQANNVSVSGGYPIHYDIQLARAGGSLGTVVARAYGRKKM